MTRRHDPIDADDAALFREAVKGVRPLNDGGRHAPPRAAPSPRPRQHELDEQEALRESREGPLPDVGDELHYRSDGIQDGVFRRLRRGAYRVGAELDLHGMRWDEAKVAMVRFLAAARDADARCVRIIHGKGLRSKGDGPGRKHRLDGWLRQRSEVLAFSSARREDGGTGAVYVLLRAN